jgi:hypothetical protein
MVTVISHRPVVLVPFIGLLLLFLWTRLHQLLLLPLFLDESSHLTRAQWVWEGQPLFLIQTGKALPMYIAALMNPYAAAPFIGRVVVVLFGMVGCAAAYAVGRELHSRQVGLLTMLLWIICPHLFFFERMALVDTTMSAMAMLALWVAILMVRRYSIPLAVLCGVLLVLTILAKFTGLVYLPIPVAVAVLVGRLTWWQRARQVLVCYVIAGLLLLPVIGYISGADADPTGQSSGLTSTNFNTLTARLQRNLTRSLETGITYYGIPMLIVVALAAGVALLRKPRRALLILAWIAVPLVVIAATAQTLWLRYFSPLAPFVLLLAAFGAVEFGVLLQRVVVFRRREVEPRTATVAFIPGMAMVVLWAFGVGIPFITTAYAAPEHLPLHPNDYREYVRWIPSGYGIRDAAQYLNSTLTQPVTVIGAAVNCNGARLYLPADSLITILCPPLDWSKDNPAVVAQIREVAIMQGQVYVLTEDKAPPTVDMRLFPERQEIAVFARPSGSNTVRLYLIPMDTAAQQSTVNMSDRTMP